MNVNIDDYDVDAIRAYFDEMRRDQEDYYGTAMMNNLPFAAVDLINVTSEYDVTGMTDYEIIAKAQEIGVLEYFKKHKRY